METARSRDERASRARELMERCGIREALGDDEVIRRADEIAAAAARYAEASGAANAAVLDETSAPSRSRT